MKDITPLPVPLGGESGAEGRPRLVILCGGTFDPPHRAHLALGAAARDELERREGVPGAGWLVYVPAARSPHKSAGPEASEGDRAAMIALAIGSAGVARAGVWTDEVERSRGSAVPSFTVDTARRAREWLDTHGLEDAGLRLLIGADQAAAFHRWRDPRGVIGLAEPAVMLRGEDGVEGLIVAMRSAGFWTEDELGAWRGRVVTTGLMDISATAARGMLHGGPSAGAEIATLVDPAVLRYIEERGLYRREAAPA